VHDALVRRARIAEAMREVLSEILLTEVKDPRLAGVVISAVDLSGDLKLARAFFSVIGDQERERQAADGLLQARGFLRRESARRMRMHNPPDLEFKRDKGFERADRIARVLDEIHETGVSEETTGDRGSGSGVRNDQDRDAEGTGDE
jgi:ribosome-binding factor A